MKRILLSFVALISVASVALADAYSIDPAHSSVSFTVSHVVGRVTGHFDKFSGDFDYTADKPAAWKSQASIETTSINTGIEKRDNHLRSAEFLDVQKFPTMTFKSTGVTDVKGNMAKLHGDLTLHGVTKPVVLDLEILGVAKDPFGKGMRAGASAKGQINRLDYGVGPASGPMASMVGKEINITIDVEAVSK
jgi:polyisoprenoid-binding protein YceI